MLALYLLASALARCDLVRLGLPETIVRLALCVLILSANPGIYGPAMAAAGGLLLRCRAATTVRPISYTVPTDGPVGAILNAAGRHPWRPSHLHFIAKATGYRELVTEVFPDDDPYLNEDTVFGVREDLVVTFVPQPAGSFPLGFDLSGKVSGPYARVDFDLVLVAV